MIEELVARAFQARTIAHREHLKTKSFSQHMALEDFYEGVVGAVDSIVETHQGRYGLIKIPTIVDKPVASISAYLLNEAMWIEANRSKISGCQAVLNLVDELTAIYLRTNYKLTNLG